MDRRSFLKTSAVAGILTTLPYSNIFSEPKKNRSKRILPPALKEGDSVGLITPGGFISEDELKESITNIEKLGYKAVPSKNVLAKWGYLGGKDVQRAEDINDMFARKEIKAIITTRGGYGCARLLPLLDYDVIKHNPKILIGYSDITALLYGIYQKTGLVCFHGPVATSTFNDFSVNNWMNTIVNASSTAKFTNPVPEKDTEYYKVKVIKNGIAEGQLAGGNLSIVVSMIGTEYDIDLKGKILFLEEVGEDPYRVDRMLTQMIEAGKLEKVKGIMLGIFTDAGAKSKDFSDTLSLFEVLSDRLGNLGVPVVYGMSFGHIVNKFTLPFGVKCRLDTNEPSFTLLEPAVKKL